MDRWEQSVGESLAMICLIAASPEYQVGLGGDESVYLQSSERESLKVKQENFTTDTLRILLPMPTQNPKKRPKAVPQKSIK